MYSGLAVKISFKSWLCCILNNVEYMSGLHLMIWQSIFWRTLLTCCRFCGPGCEFISDAELVVLDADVGAVCFMFWPHKTKCCVWISIHMLEKYVTISLSSERDDTASTKYVFYRTHLVYIAHFLADRRGPAHLSCDILSQYWG